MDLTIIAVLAALGTAICDGISTVQEKIGADKERAVRSFDSTLLLRMLRNTPYLLGILLAVIGYGLSLIALRVLPLFLVQSIIAASVVVTAFGEQTILHKRLNRQTYIALSVIIIGLLLLSISAVAGHARVNGQTTKYLIELLPVPIAIIGLAFIYIRKKLSAPILAGLAGLAYGNTSTIARIFVYPHELWRAFENPLLYSLIASAILGQYLFIVSLQRTTATKSNAVMIALQTLGPAIFGLLFFDDKIRSGFQGLVLVGCILVVVGSAATTVAVKPLAQYKRLFVN